ncbi:MAG: Hint domain-containing protein [Ottowia sp.]|nr:Hint domain-containing protein [Ottowia sp.]
MTGTHLIATGTKGKTGVLNVDGSRFITDLQDSQDQDGYVIDGGIGVNVNGLPMINGSLDVKEYKKYRVIQRATIANIGGIPDVGDPASLMMVTRNDSTGPVNITASYAYSNKNKKLRPCCFAPGTLVATPAGYRKIETLKIGDKVWTKRDDNSGAVFSAAITTTHVRDDQPIYKLTLKQVTADGSTQQDYLFVTPSHPFYVKQRGFIPAIDLKTGDELSSLHAPQGVITIVTSFTRVSDQGRTHNLSVAIGETFFVGTLNAWVHNTGPCPRHGAFKKYQEKLAVNKSLWDYAQTPIQKVQAFQLGVFNQLVALENKLKLFKNDKTKLTDFSQAEKARQADSGKALLIKITNDLNQIQKDITALKTDTQSIEHHLALANKNKDGRLASIQKVTDTWTQAKTKKQAIDSFKEKIQLDIANLTLIKNKLHTDRPDKLDALTKSDNELLNSLTKKLEDTSTELNGALDNYIGVEDHFYDALTAVSVAAKHIDGPQARDYIKKLNIATDDIIAADNAFKDTLAKHSQTIKSVGDEFHVEIEESQKQRKDSVSSIKSFLGEHKKNANFVKDEVINERHSEAIQIIHGSEEKIIKALSWTKGLDENANVLTDIANAKFHYEKHKNDFAYADTGDYVLGAYLFSNELIKSTQFDKTRSGISEYNQNGIRIKKRPRNDAATNGLYDILYYDEKTRIFAVETIESVAGKGMQKGFRTMFKRDPESANRAFQPNTSVRTDF